MGRGGWVRLLITGGAAVLLCACGDDDTPAPEDAGGMDGGTRDAGRTGLPDGVVGRACSNETQCEGGTCAMQISGLDLTGTQTDAPGGYCTASCERDEDCGAGGFCMPTISVNVTVTGQCLATCTSTTDCRDGYECGGGLTFPVTIPDTCRPRPETDQLEDGVAGDMCSAAEDCPGGMCLTTRTSLAGSMVLPGGYCSGRCVEDANCGEGGVCLPSLVGGAGSCYQACSDDADCTRDGYRCRVLRGSIRGCNPAPDPLPANTSGKACTSDGDCGGNAGSCLNELPASGIAGVIGRVVPAPGGYCSQACAEDGDCGEGGVCTGGVLGGGYCYDVCASTADCRDGYVCEDRGGGIPGAGGAIDAGAGMRSTTVCVPEPPPDEEDAGL